MTIEEKITELEIQSAHQESDIADLNDVIIDQQNTIAKLESRLEKIESALQNGSANIKDPSEETPPPHY